MSQLSVSTLRSRGVTLIELMVVVAILGIIAAVALPSYTSHVRKGHRAAAQSYMMTLASRQGEILVGSNSYASRTELLDLLPVPPSVAKYYDITMPVTATPPKFKITATPKTGSQQVPDGFISLDQAGEKLPADKW
jgi:type IV pilus assembly protein PilE